MGSVIPRVPWRCTYEVKTANWHQKIYATLDTQHHKILFVSYLNIIKDDVDDRHQFHRLAGQRICRLDAVDLGEAITEVDRVLKPTRHWFFWKKHLPAMRVIYPGGPRERRTEVGIVVANPKEQKKLLTLLREALVIVSDVN